MKKHIAVLIIFALCLGLSACGAETGKAEEIVLPSIPTPMPVQNLPTMPEDSGDQDPEDTQAADPAEKKYPWEEEFDPTGYTVRKGEFGEGRTISWIKGYKNGRSIVYYNSGMIEDSYFYPSGALSHTCVYYADGSYSEVRRLDNGDVVTLPDGTKISGLGTVFYIMTINADGSWKETQYNSEEIPELEIRQLADGSYQEIRYNSAGVSVHEITRGLDGYYYEILWYDNGDINKIITDDPAAGTYMEEIYYENGQLKHKKSQTSDEEQEARYDEEGFLTYFHTKLADYEIELIVDGSGKLVKAIENGQTIEDPTALAQYVTSYNFRN